MINILTPQPYRILEIVHETSAEYTFRVAGRFQLKHGQFFMLSIPKYGEAPISVSAMGDDWVEFTIRKVGRVTEGIFALKPGGTLFMRGPYGNYFPIDDFAKKDLVVIAGGTGIAAVRSMLNHYFEHFDELKSLHLLAGFKNMDSIIFAEDLSKFRTCFNTIYSLDDMKIEGFEKGLVTSNINRIPFASFTDYNTVIVGPPAMMQATANECLANGAEASKLWLSFERKMSCAVGKCGHCKINETYVCLEGPIFSYVSVKNMID